MLKERLQTNNTGDQGNDALLPSIKGVPAASIAEKLNRDEVIAEFMQMGFEHIEIQRALDTSNNDLDLAHAILSEVNSLLCYAVF